MSAILSLSATDLDEVASWPRDGLNYPAFRFIHSISYQGRVPKLIRQMCTPCL